MEQKYVIKMREKVSKLSIEDMKERDKYLKGLHTGKIQGPMTGHPTIDKPWQSYFNMDKFYDIKNTKTIYQDIYDENQDHLDDIALIYFGSQITYRELFENIDNAAKALVANGVKAGSYVTVCCAGIPECIYTLYALAKLGAVANLMAPYFDKKQMTERINDCHSELLICMDKFYPEIKDAVNKSTIQKTVIIPTLNSSKLSFIPSKYQFIPSMKKNLWNNFIDDAKGNEVPKTFEYVKDYPLCMVYSSGTTGASKAILLSHDSFQYSVLSYDANTVDVIRGQKMYQIIPPWYSTGFNTSIHLPFHKGLQVFQDPRFEREIFVKNIIEQEIDYAVAPTSMYEGFLDEKLVAGRKLTRLGNPFEGGEPLTSEKKQKIEAVFKKMGAPYSIIKIGYGQCECGAQATSQSQHIIHVEGSVGIPIPGVTIAIYDDDGNELTYGQRGNIWINTPCGMLRYFNNEEATEKYFYVDELGVKWSRTGDIGYMNSDGELFIEGRKEDCAIINDKTLFNFDVERPIRKREELKDVDCIPKPRFQELVSAHEFEYTEEDKGLYDTDIHAYDLALHIVLSDNSKKAFKSPEAQIEEFKAIQQAIFDEYHDIDMVPKYFKIRKSFPYKPSGKRDIEALGNETEGFTYVDSSYLLKKPNQRKRN